MVVKERLEFKVTGFILSAVLLGVIIAAVVAIIFIREDIFMVAQKTSEKNLDFTISIITKDIEDSMLAGKGTETKAMIERYKAIESKITSILVLNHEGREAFSKVGGPVEVSAINKIKETGAPIVELSKDSIHFYKPLINSERCMKCHGSQDKVLGAVKISTLLPLDIAYERAAQRVRVVIIGLILGLLLLGILLWFVLKKVIIKPVGQIAGATRMLAEGDLSFPIDIRSKDELGRLSHDLKKSLKSTSKVLRKIKDLTERATTTTRSIEDESKKVFDGAQLETEAVGNISSSIEEMNASMGEIADSTSGLSSSAEQSATAVNEMVATADEIAKNTIEISAALDTASSSMEEISITIKEVAKSTEELSLSAEETLSAAEEISVSVKEVESNIKEAARLSEKVTLDASGLGMEAINKTIDGMEIIKNSVERTAESIKALGGRSEEIGNILTVINDITEQTTLLALNAAILAAQAGEHGKGFSVVADEIKALAERTAVSTKEIESLIQAVQLEVKGTVKASEEGLKKVQEGSRLSKEAREALRKIVESSQKSSEMALSIERSTSEQTKGVKFVTDSMEKVRDMVAQTVRATSEQTKGVGLIVSGIEKIRDLSKHLKNATLEQSKGGKQIYEAVENVSERIQEISRAVNEQKVGSDQIMNAITKIKDIPAENKTRTYNILKSLKDLLNDTTILMTEMEWFKNIEAVDVLRMGVVPLESVTEMMVKFTPFMNYLAKKIGIDIEFESAMTFEEAIREIGEGKTGICYMTPSTYIEAHDKYGVDVVAMALRKGKPYQHSIIIAREGGKINKIEDIKGKSFAFGDAHSTSSHIMPRAMLFEAGIDIKDLSYHHFLGHHDDVARAVLKGEFDAGGIMESTANKFKGEGLKFIATSPEIPEFNICVSKNLPEEIKRLIRGAILELNDRTEEGATVLRSITPDYTGFVAASDRDYDGIRDMMKRLGLY